MSAYFDNKLNYSLGDEDTNLEYQILAEECSHVVSVAGSGGRVLPLLAKNPKQMTCIDISKLQLCLTELRIIALKQLDYDDFLGFLGYPPFCYTNDKREKIFSYLKLSEKTKLTLNEYFQKNKWVPIIYMGHFEKMLVFFSKLIRAFTLNKIQNIFFFNGLDEQRQYFASAQFPRKGWKLAVQLLGNTTSLNGLLYKGAFPIKNLPNSYAEIYLDIFERIFTKIPAKKSFFLQLLLLGSILYPEGNPIEANENIFYAARKNINNVEISYQNNDVLSVIRSTQKPVDFLSLSDVPSFFSNSLELSFLQDIRSNLAEQAKIVFRGHMRIAQPLMQGYKNITEQYKTLISQETTQLWVPTILIKSVKKTYD